MLKRFVGCINASGLLTFNLAQCEWNTLKNHCAWIWYTRVVHKLLRQRKLKETWKRYKLEFTWLDTSTLFLSTCKISIMWLHSTDRREHKKSITLRYTEHSDVANITSAGYNGFDAIVTASLLPNIHTIQAMHFIWRWTYLCCFAVQYPSVCWAPCCSEFNTINIKLSVITVCLKFLNLVGPRTLLKTVRVIDRRRLWKHWYHSLSFPVVGLISIGDLPSSTHKIMYVRCSALSPKTPIKTAISLFSLQ